MENQIFEAIYLYYIFNSKATKISPNQHAGLQIPFDRAFFENFKATFFIEFFDKSFYFVMLHELAKFHHQTVFFCQVIQ